MPDIDYSIATKTQTPNSMDSIGKMLNMATTSQNLQRGAQDIQRGGVALKQEQMDIGERDALRSLSARLGEFKTESGDPDYPRLIEAATAAAPKTGMKWVQDISAAHVNSVAAKSAVNKLSGEQRAEIGQVVMAVADRPLAEQESAIDAVVKGNPQLKPWAEIAKSRLKATPEKDRKMTAIKFAQATMSPGDQNQALGQRVSTGAELKPAGPIAEAGGTSTLPVQMGPGGLENIEIDALGNKHVVSRSPSGAILSTRPVPGSTAPGGAAPGGGKGFATLNPGDATEIPIRTKERADSNAAAAQVPEQHFNNQQIIKLAPESLVGTGAQSWSKVFSANGLQWIPGEEAANLQRLGHFMARQTEANSKAMGAGTDASREMSEKATGTTAWTPQAIVSTAKVNDAFATGVDYFNRGMEKAIAANNGNVLAVRDFKNAWTRNFDPKAMQLDNAIRAGDKAEIEEVLKSVGGRGSRQAQDLARKARNLEKLANDGRL